MNENNGKRFVWLFIGLFILLFAFAGFNELSGNEKTGDTVSIDEMIKTIVQSDKLLSDIPTVIPEESEIPEEYLNVFRLEKEQIATQKLIGDYVYVYNPNTNITSLYYIVNNNTLLLYKSNEGMQYSKKSFAPFKEEVEQIYAQTL